MAIAFALEYKTSMQSKNRTISASRPPTTPQYQSPHVVIFDGAKSFLRWRGHLPKQNWIVLLDQTETKLRDAAVVVNQCPEPVRREMLE